MLLEGKKVFVGPFLKRTDRPADKEAHYTNIYVKNLAESVTEEQLDKMFGKYGKVWCCTFQIASAVWRASALSCFAPQAVHRLVHTFVTHRHPVAHHDRPCCRSLMSSVPIKQCTAWAKSTMLMC